MDWVTTMLGLDVDLGFWYETSILSIIIFYNFLKIKANSTNMISTNLINTFHIKILATMTLSHL
jgi:hypothetical protein